MGQIAQHVGHDQRLGLERLLTRKREELAHQIGGPVRVLLDLHDVGEALLARPVAQQEQVAEADHRRQQVVEVVSDAAGKLAHRLHLLRLAELNFQVPLGGAVEAVQDHRLVAGRIANPRREHRDNAIGRPFGHDVDRTVGQLARRDRFEPLGKVAPGCRPEPGWRGRRRDFVQRAAHHFLEGLVADVERAVSGDKRDPDRRILEKLQRPLLRVAGVGRGRIRVDGFGGGDFFHAPR